MLCDIEVQDTPTVVTDDEKAIERAEGDRRNSEEVHRGNRFTVITEKGKPVPGRLRISRRPFHPTRDRSLRDIKAEHEKLAMDAWRSPRGVLNDHSEDQFLNLLRRRLSSPDRPPDLGDQLPVQTESGPVPTHHRFGRDHNEGLLPSGPKSTNGEPEELVESRNLQPTASNVAQLFDPWICSIALRALAALSRLSCVVHCFSDIVLTAV